MPSPARATAARRSPLEKHKQWLLDLAAAEPDLTLDEVSVRLGKPRASRDLCGAPKRAPIPITDAGYRSHVIDAEELSLAAGAVIYVGAGIEREAETKRWKIADAHVRQLKLDL